MDVVIPHILSGQGGFGQITQQLGREITAAGDTVVGTMKGIQDQLDLVEAQRLENDMRTDKQKSYDSFLRSQDGTDSTAMDTLKAEDERISQNYIRQSSNGNVSRYLTKVGLLTQRQYLVGAQKELDNKLFNTSIEAAKIKTDDAIRESAKTGEYESGLSSVNDYLEMQRGFFGPVTDTLKKQETQRFTENYLRVSLQNPATAPLIVQRMADPEQKNKFFANIDANKIDDMEKLLRQGQMHAGVTNELVDLKTRYIDNQEKTQYGTGIQGAIKEAESAKYTKKVGYEAQQHIIGSLTTQWRREEDAYKVHADDVTGGLLSMIIDKQDPETILNNIDNSDLRTADKARAKSWLDNDRKAQLRESYEARAETRAARYEARQKAQDISDGLAGDIQAKIATGEVDTVQDIYNEIPHGLKLATAKQIAGELTQLQKNPDIKFGIDVIKEAGKRRVFDSDPVKNKGLEGEAIQKFTKAWLSKKLDDKDITGMSAENVASQIVEPKKTHWLKTVMDNVMYPWNKNNAINTPRQSQGQMVTIEGKQYKDGDIYTDKNGKQSRVKVRF